MVVFTFNKLYSWMHSACFPCWKKRLVSRWTSILLVSYLIIEHCTLVKYFIRNTPIPILIRHACDSSRNSWASTHILSFSMLVFAGNEITSGWLYFWGSATTLNKTKRTYNHASVLPVTGRVKTGHWRGPGPEFSAWRQRLSITHVNRSISACSPQAKR